MSPARRWGFIVAAGEVDGGEYSWAQRRWVTKQ